MPKSRQIPPRRIFLVYKKSVYEKFVLEEKNTHLNRLVKQKHISARALLQNHKQHLAALHHIRKTIEAAGLDCTLANRSTVLDLTDHDLILTVGGDGTFLRTAQSLRKGRILGVNSAPTVSVGALCSITIHQWDECLQRLLNGQFKTLPLCRIAIRVNGTLHSIEPINDVLFTNISPAATSRYLVRWRGRTEDHQSSGIWIATPSGSTAAIRAAGGHKQKPTENRLQFLVREPYQGKRNPYKTLHNFIKPGEKFTIINKMVQSCLYFDGPASALNLNYGDKIEFTVSKRVLEKVVF